ncbi:flagellin [Chitinibacter sp. ZOR0017]|uniref:flagellin N-terminal helical domain-containing protein n=1 Tax=Chitinibacter sp. ZOR0017 TaxID=1339254 RepID=UPI000645BD80|nr:flagellin [Chitinibacter sp. ZOR0017]
MALNINTNVSSLTALRSGNNVQETQNRTLASIASGKRINSAADDAAGLAIAERFAAQILGNNQAVRNLNDAVSVSQTADGALSSLSDNTSRIRELTVAAGNSTLTASDRQALQAEVDQLQQSNQDIIQNTQFNGQPLLQGSSFNFQAGANANQNLGLNLDNLSSSASNVDLSNASSIGDALDRLDSSLANINAQRGNLGAFQSRVEASINNLTTSSINQAAAKSRIADTDYASATAQRAQQDILSQANLAMQAQANASGKQVLSLLK